MTTHDLTDRRWLTPAHRAALAAGALDLPDRVNEHPSVLVSIPYRAAGTPVAWIDRGCAEVVFHAARLGAPTAESCENAGRANGWEDMPTFWFDDEDGMERFGDLVAGLQTRGDWCWYYPRSVRDLLVRLSDYVLPGAFPRPKPKDGPWAVAIPARDLPRVAAALRQREAPEAVRPPGLYGP